MPGVSYLGANCTGHGDWPPRPNNSASSDVFVNNIAVHRQTDGWAVHCNSDPECHASALSSGSSTVYVNNLQCSRIGDPVACGSSIAQGSSDVFSG
jgi:uncharacterized Zn-binding protein involved in type VI secretion